MSTFDVESNAEGWPPRRRSGPKGPSIPPSVVAFGGILLVLAMLIGLMGVTGRLGVTQVQDTEVAVVVNYVSGNREVALDPGFKLYIPFVEEVFKIDKSSQEFVMSGTEYVDANHVPRLTVRANDGSNFWFDEIKILYELIPGDAAKVLEDSGAGDRFKQNWIKAYARSVLRDEFGRYSAVDAADPTQYTAAGTASKVRMNELLAPHGIVVTDIVTPKPKFDADYERAIEDRKVADQEVQRLKARFEQLEQEKEQRIAAVLKEKEIELRALQGDLAKQKLAAQENAIKLTQAAKAYAIERQKAGEGEFAQLTAQARGMEAKYTKEAEGLAVKAQALEQRGEVVVREALIEKLMNIRFTLVPYSRDPAPKRLEHSGNTRNAQRDSSTEGGQ